MSSRPSRRLPRRRLPSRPRPRRWPRPRRDRRPQLRSPSDGERVTMELVVARIARSHGLRGEVAVEVRTDSPEIRFAEGAVLRTQTGNRTLTVTGSRPHSGRLLVTFAEVHDRTAADMLRGILLV